MSQTHLGCAKDVQTFPHDTGAASLQDLLPPRGARAQVNFGLPSVAGTDREAFTKTPISVPPLGRRAAGAQGVSAVFRMI